MYIYTFIIIFVHIFVSVELIICKLYYPNFARSIYPKVV